MRTPKRRLLVLTAVLFAICALPAPPARAFQEHTPAGHAAETGSPEAPAVHEGGGHGTAASTNPFSGDWGNVIFTLLVFLLLLGFLTKAAWKPLLNWQQERERVIRDTLDRARKEREEAERVLAEYKRQIDRAREEATAIVEEGRRDAETTRRRMQDEAKKESDEMVARARREIQLATDTALKDLYDRTADLAVNVAGNIIRKSLSAEDHRGLVQESLERMRSGNGAGASAGTARR
jgi:F-type H+-transporting ATPase subunit b